MTRSNRPSRRCRTVIDLPFMLTLVWLLHWNASTAVSGPPGDDVFATWDELAPRVQNILLEAEGTVTFTPGADVLIDSSEPVVLRRPAAVGVSPAARSGESAAMYAMAQLARIHGGGQLLLFDGRDWAHGGPLCRSAVPTF